MLLWQFGTWIHLGQNSPKPSLYISTLALPQLKVDEMNMLGFDRPTGSGADLKELEYISALHQTCTSVRKDASIDG